MTFGYRYTLERRENGWWQRPIMSMACRGQQTIFF